MNIYSTVIEKSARGVVRSEKNARRIARRGGGAGKSASQPTRKGGGNSLLAGIGGALGLTAKITSGQRAAMAQQSVRANAFGLMLALAAGIALIGGLIAAYLFR